MVQKTVITPVKKVIEEQVHPKAWVRNSKRSVGEGQVFGYLIGDKMGRTLSGRGTQVDDWLAYEH